MAQAKRDDVFLSHNSADKPAVEELARQLIREGIQPWLDIWNLILGAPRQEARPITFELLRIADDRHRLPQLRPADHSGW